MINPSSLEYFIEKLRALNDVHSIDQAQDLESAPVSYTHLTLPTIYSV